MTALTTTVERWSNARTMSETTAMLETTAAVVHTWILWEERK
uniref:Uncharacterized protein n=1 Tax=Arundo donax TaxID=35708 RepID=A0A0A9BKC1_ARUDO